MKKFILIIVVTLFSIVKSYGQGPMTMGALFIGSKSLLNGFTSDIDKISQKRLAEAFEMLELLLDQIDGRLKDHYNTIKSDLSKEERELYNALDAVYITLSKDFKFVLDEIIRI